MTSALTPKIEQEIIRRLKQGGDKDDVILFLCEQAGMTWSEAEWLLADVESTHRHAITLAQSPLLVGLALGTFLTGVASIAYAAYDLVRAAQSLAMADITDMGIITGTTSYLYFYGGQMAVLVLMGLGMIIGSVKGMRGVWEAIFAKLGLFE